MRETSVSRIKIGAKAELSRIGERAVASGFLRAIVPDVGVDCMLDNLYHVFENIVKIRHKSSIITCCQTVPAKQVIVNIHCNPETR
jgi:hypothetical protein